MNRILLALTLAALFESPNAIADDASAHFAAHFGASYAITTVAYGLLSKGFGSERTPSFVASAALALAIGFAYKYVELVQGGAADSIPRAMLQNGLGVAGAGLTILAFKF